jgi:hypothetical protein
VVGRRRRPEGPEPPPVPDFARLQPRRCAPIATQDIALITALHPVQHFLQSLGLARWKQLTDNQDGDPDVLVSGNGELAQRLPARISRIPVLDVPSMFPPVDGEDDGPIQGIGDRRGRPHDKP